MTRKRIYSKDFSTSSAVPQLREKGIQVQFEAFFPHDIIMRKSSKAQEVAEGSQGPCEKGKKRLSRPAELLGDNVERLGKYYIVKK
jgi:hypothetical protein